jgi:anti-sigma factor RsiW
VDSNECPANPEEVAEAYAMGTLPKEQLIEFEDHYVTCEACATVLYKTIDYVDAMRRAAKTLRSMPQPPVLAAK